MAAAGSEAVEMPESSTTEELATKPEVEAVEVPGSTSEDVTTKAQVEAEEVTKLIESDKEETLKTALNALVQGKRHLLVKDLPHACSALGDACRMLSEIYGPISAEHADAHLYYGRALLDSARQELSVFQAPGADGKDDDEEDTEDEEGGDGIEEDEEEGEGEGDEEGENEAAADTTEDAKEDLVANGEAEAVAAVPEEAEAEAVPVEEDLSTASPKPGPSTDNDNEQPSTSRGVGENDETNIEEELSNLELSWEVFEIAKLGYIKQLEIVQKTHEDVPEDKKSEVEAQCNALNKKIADTHSYLGEVSIESEIYEKAIEDFRTAISMYTEMGDPHSREIAQCYFHIGIAHGLAQNFPGSVESLEQAVAIIEGRVKSHKEKLEELKKSEKRDTEAIEKLEAEIQDLEELIPDIRTRITDTIEQEKETKKTAEEEKMEVEIMERSSPVKNPNPPVANDISHLVKKRKKIEEPSAPANGSGVEHGESEPPSKKACTSVEDAGTVSSSNGHSASNGNGSLA